MKPIEKYQHKFIDLLIKAETELGAPLAVTVTSEQRTQVSLFKSKSIREYSCIITTNNLPSQ